MICTLMLPNAACFPWGSFRCFSCQFLPTPQQKQHSGEGHRLFSSSFRDTKRPGKRQVRDSFTGLTKTSLPTPTLPLTNPNADGKGSCLVQKLKLSANARLKNGQRSSP